MSSKKRDRKDIHQNQNFRGSYLKITGKKLQILAFILNLMVAMVTKMAAQIDLK